MTDVGAWDPGAKRREPEPALLERLSALVREHGDAAPQQLGAEQSRELAWLMGVANDIWERIGEAHDTATLTALVRFFTLAERDLAGWEAGAASPVIALVRVLKRRGAFDVELTRWIHARTHNRFLPHGSLQDRL